METTLMECEDGGGGADGGGGGNDDDDDDENADEGPYLETITKKWRLNPGTWLLFWRLGLPLP